MRKKAQGNGNSNKILAEINDRFLCKPQLKKHAQIPVIFTQKTCM